MIFVCERPIGWEMSKFQDPLTNGYFSFISTRSRGHSRRCSRCRRQAEDPIDLELTQVQIPIRVLNPFSRSPTQLF